MHNVAYLLHSPADMLGEAFVVTYLVEKIITADDDDSPS